MKNIGCVIRRGWERPAREVVELFRDMPVANIDDCMNRTASAVWELRPLNSAKLLGTAFTVKVPEGDNLMFHKAMDMAVPGDVICIDAGGDAHRAILGEIMASYCKKRGIAGIVVDGSVRDADELAAMDFPVYARGAVPNGPYKNGPGEIGMVISLGGIIIHPGDIIVGDGDGILAIRPEDAVELAKQVRAVQEKEEKLMRGIREDGVYPRPWVDEKLEEIGCQYI